MRSSVVEKTGYGGRCCVLGGRGEDVRLRLSLEVDGHYGGAHVMLRPASVGTGVIAGGAVRVVLELAGVENALGKQIGSENPLNNARAVVVAVSSMKTFAQVSTDKGIPMQELWK
ncbi:unnamed protein product [Calypogeia fissa]